jgi:hypothetical protein
MFLAMPSAAATGYPFATHFLTMSSYDSIGADPADGLTVTDVVPGSYPERKSSAFITVARISHEGFSTPVPW